MLVGLTQTAGAQFLDGAHHRARHVAHLFLYSGVLVQRVVAVVVRLAIADAAVELGGRYRSGSSTPASRTGCSDGLRRPPHRHERPRRTRDPALRARSGARFSRSHRGRCRRCGRCRTPAKHATAWWGCPGPAGSGRWPARWPATLPTARTPGRRNPVPPGGSVGPCGLRRRPARRCLPDARISIIALTFMMRGSAPDHERLPH